MCMLIWLNSTFSHIFQHHSCCRYRRCSVVVVGAVATRKCIKTLYVEYATQQLTVNVWMLMSDEWRIFALGYFHFQSLRAHRISSDFFPIVFVSSLFHSSSFALPVLQFPSTSNMAKKARRVKRAMLTMNIVWEQKQWQVEKTIWTPRQRQHFLLNLPVCERMVTIRRNRSVHTNTPTAYTLFRHWTKSVNGLEATQTKCDVTKNGFGKRKWEYERKRDKGGEFWRNLIVCTIADESVMRRQSLKHTLDESIVMAPTTVILQVQGLKG